MSYPLGLEGFLHRAFLNRKLLVTKNIINQLIFIILVDYQTLLLKKIEKKNMLKNICIKNINYRPKCKISITFGLENIK